MPVWFIRDVSARRRAHMGNVILPALDEAPAIPGVLAGIPEGWTPDRRRQRLGRRLGRHRSQPRRDRGHRTSTRLRGCVSCRPRGRHRGPRRVHGLRRLVRRQRPRPRRGARASPAMPTSCSAPGAPDAGSGAWPWHLRVANRSLARSVRRRTGVVLDDLGPMRVARREPRSLALGRPRPTLRLAARDGPAGRRRGLAHRRGAGLVPPQGRPVEGHRHGSVAWSRTVHDMRVALR